MAADGPQVDQAREYIAPGGRWGAAAAATIAVGRTPASMAGRRRIRRTRPSGVVGESSRIRAVRFVNHSSRFDRVAIVLLPWDNNIMMASVVGRPMKQDEVDSSSSLSRSRHCRSSPPPVITIIPSHCRHGFRLPSYFFSELQNEAFFVFKKAQIIKPNITFYEQHLCKDRVHVTYSMMFLTVFPSVWITLLISTTTYIIYFSKYCYMKITNM